MSKAHAHLILVGVLCLSFCPWSHALAGPAGYAMWFDGEDDEIVIPHHESISFLAPPEAMTLEFWFKRGGPRDGVYHLMGKRTDCERVNYNFGIEGADHSVLGFATAVGYSYEVFFAPLPAPDTTWIHVAVTADGTEVRIYLNGEFAIAAPGIIATEVSAPLKLGQSGTCGSWMRLIGWMDEVRFWNVARSAEEIHDSYNRPLDPATSGLVGYWTFDEDLTNQSVYDLSPMGNHGTLGADDQSASDDPLRVPSTVPLTCPGTPCPYAASDVDCNGVTDIVDVVLSVSSAFRNVPEPQPCCSYR